MQPDKKQCLLLKLSILLGLIFSLTQCAPQSEPVVSAAIEMADAQPTLAIQNWPNDNSAVARVHVVTIPPNYPVEVGLSETLKTVEAFAAETGAMAVLNGGFFDPNNAQTTSFVTINGTLGADPRENQRLMNNPDLVPYLDQILNRSEFRRYDCAGHVRYDITVHNEPVSHGCTLHSALGAGPQLRPDTSQAEGFTDYSNGTLIRDAIGSQRRNARSAIGIQSDGSLLWVMVAQVEPAGGMTLAELAGFMAVAGAQKALNLDGGSSSSSYFDLQSMSGITQDNLQSSIEPASPNQSQLLRPVKSVLYLPALPKENSF